MKRTLPLLALLCLVSVAAAQEKFPFLAQTVRKGVNIRAGQSANFERLGQLEKGDHVVVTDQSYSWYQIRLPRHATCYINAKYVRPIRDGVGEVSGNRVNVRARADTRAAILGQVGKGELVRIKKQSGEWYQIEPVAKTHGWVLAEYVSFISEQVPESQRVELPTRNIYTKKRLAEKEKKAAKKKVKKEARRQVAAVVKPVAPTQPVKPPPPPEPEVERVTAVGVIEDLGEKSLSQDIRHRIIVDENTVYFVRGHRRIIDGFLHNKVKIEGLVQSDIKASYPVVLVTKIHLVL